MKLCRGCYTILDRSAFNTDRSQEDGLNIRCRECARSYKRENYHQRPDVKTKKLIRAGQRQYRQRPEVIAVKREYQRAQQREYQARPEIKERMREYAKSYGPSYSVLKKYNVAQYQYDRMFEYQHGRCAICGTEEAGGNSTRLRVDHCHISGLVRGLLCDRCNCQLPDMVLLNKMFEYDSDPPAIQLFGPIFVEEEGFQLPILQHAQLMEFQGWHCALCDATEPGGSGRGTHKFRHDHCHDVYILRGLLCDPCNLRTPSFDRLMAMVAYDSDPPAVRAIGRVFV